MSEPKTREEKLLEKLREVDARLTTVKQLLGSSAEDFQSKIERAEKRKKSAKGDAQFVKVGSTMVEGTDKLEALLVLEECYSGLLGLRGKHPAKESEALLERKIKILQELLL